MGDNPGVILPAAIPGRSVKIVNLGNPGTSLYVYSQPPVSLTDGTSLNSTLITVNSTYGLYPGMTLPTIVDSGTGLFAAGTYVVSINSSTTFIVNIIPTTNLASASFSAGTDSTITSLDHTASYTMTTGTTVEFIAVSTSKWQVSSAALLGTTNGASGPVGYSVGSLLYASDTYGSVNGLSDITPTGIPLLSGGSNNPPVYMALNLANSSIVNGVTAPAYGLLPIANGGTGTNGSGLISAGTSYNLVNSTATSINLGGAATTMSIGAITGTTTVNNNLVIGSNLSVGGDTIITGNLTVRGSQFTINSTTSTLADNIIELNKPAAGWLQSDTGRDIGLKYDYYKSLSTQFIITNSSCVGSIATLTLADSTVILPIGTVINVGSTLTGYSGTWITTGAALAGQVSFVITPTANITTIGTISVVTSISVTSASSTLTTATINYNSTQTLIQASATVTLNSISVSGYNTGGVVVGGLGTGTYTVVTAGPGTFTITTTGSGLDTPAINTGNIIFGSLYAFSGWVDSTDVFSFYTEGYEATGAFTGQFGVIKSGGLAVLIPSGISADIIAAGAALSVASKPFFDNSSSVSTINAQAAIVGIAAATMGALNTGITYTNAASLYIASAPVSYPTNVTITNAYAIQVATGDTLLGGNLAVNGMTLSSIAPTFSLLNTGVSTLNSFGSASSINIGGASTNSYTLKGSTAGVTFTIGGLATTGNNIILSGIPTSTVSIDSNVTTGTVNLFNTISSGTINIGGNSPSVVIGNRVANSTLTISGAASGTSTIGSSLSVLTANVFNSIITTGNLFGNATILNIANNATAPITGSIGRNSTFASTYTFGGQINSGTNAIKIGSGTNAIVSFDSESTSVTANLFTSVTGQINIGTSTVTISIGAPAVNLIVGRSAGDSKLTITGATAGTSTISASLGVVTANVFNTVTTVGNLFGVSPITNIATSVSVGTASTLLFGSAVTAGIINTLSINSNGGTVAFDSPSATGTGTIFNSVVSTVNYSTSATAINIGSTSGTARINTPSVIIGVTNSNNTLTINGNGTAGTVQVNSNVTTGTVNLFSTTSGTITIGSTNITVGQAGVVKLGVSPSHLATGNEVVTASWVLNNINSQLSTSINLDNTIIITPVDYVTLVTTVTVGIFYTIAVVGTTNWNDIASTTGITYKVGSTLVAAITGTITGSGSVYTGHAFTWSSQRAVKYQIQATQVGSASTRAQTSELMITHDAPSLLFTGASTSGSSTTLTVVSNSGLYIGMTIAINTNSGSDIINGTGAGSTIITAINGTTVSLASAVTISSGSILKAFLATAFSATIIATNTTTTMYYVELSGVLGAVYPGMIVTGTGAATVGTYITSINNTTGTITFSQALTGSVAGFVITGTPNVYMTEYAALETNGTICTFTAQTTITAPYYIQLTTKPLTVTGSAIQLGTLLETVIRLEKSYIGLN